MKKGRELLDTSMSIAALSVDMHQAENMQNLGIAVLKKAMDTSTEGVDELLDVVSGSLDPNLGGNIDVLA